MAYDAGGIEYNIDVETKALTKGEKEVDRSLGRMQKDFKQTEKEASNLSKSIKGLGGIIAGAFAINQITSVIRLADNMQMLEGRVRRVTSSTEEFDETMKSLYQTANDTGSTISDVVTIFERFKVTASEIGATNDQVLVFTDTLAKLGRVGGSSAEEMNNAFVQLSQGLAGGILRAEEFNSIIEQTPEVARAIAREMGISMGELRQAMLDGELTAKEVFEAILRASEDANEELGKLPETIEMASARLVNNLTQALTGVNKELSATERIAITIGALADWLAPDSKQDQLNELNDQLRDVLTDYKELQGVIDDSPKDAPMLEWYNTRLKKLRGEADGLFKKIQELNGEIASESTPVELTITGGAGATKSSTAREDAAASRDFIKGFGISGESDVFAGNADSEATAYSRQILSENETLLEALERRREMIELFQEWEIGSAEAHAQALEEIAKQEAAEERRIMSERLSAGSDFFGASADLIGAFAGESSNAYKALFAVSKGFAIANAALQLQTAIANASALPWPANLAAITQAATLGASIASNVASITYSGGARQFGGGTSPGSMYAINETGAPEVRSYGGKDYLMETQNAKVTPLDKMGGGGVSVQIINEPGVRATVVSENERQVIIRAAIEQMDNKLQQDIINGTGKAGKASNQVFGQGNTRGIPQ